MAKKVDLKTTADELLKAYPNQHKIFMTSDGQGFFTKGDAYNHANQRKLEVETFFREGHTIEDDSTLEDELRLAEEAAVKAGQILDRVIDAANIDGEEDFEATDGDHAAVKAVCELRQKAADAKDAVDLANENFSKAQTELSEEQSKRAAAESDLETANEGNTKLSNKVTKLEEQVNSLSKQLGEANKKLNAKK